MRVLIFASMVGRGGITRVMEVLVPALAGAGVDAEILSQTYNESGREIVWGEHFPFHQLRPVEKLPPHPKQFQFLIDNAQEMVDHALELEQSGGFDLVWAATAWWSIGAAAYAKFRAPLVCSIPDFAFDHFSMGNTLDTYFRTAALRISERADLTIFPSKFQEGWAREYYRFENTAVVPYSIDFSRLRGLDPAPIEGIPDRFLLAFHCLHHKDPETIIRAYAEAKRRKSQLPPLVLGGIETEALLEEFSLSKHIRYVRGVIDDLQLEIGRDLFVTGTVSDAELAWLYQHAQMALVASRSEGDLSGSIHEAIYFKTPLIYSNIPPFTDRLIHTRHGLCFPVGNWNKMADAICEIQDYPSVAALRAARAKLDFPEETATEVRGHVKAFEWVLSQKKERR